MTTDELDLYIDNWQGPGEIGIKLDTADTTGWGAVVRWTPIPNDSTTDAAIADLSLVFLVGGPPNAREALALAIERLERLLPLWPEIKMLLFPHVS